MDIFQRLRKLLTFIQAAGTARKRDAQRSSGQRSKIVLKNRGPMFWYSLNAVPLAFARPMKAMGLQK